MKLASVSVVMITLPLHRKRKSRHQVSRCKSRRDRLHCFRVGFATPEAAEQEHARQAAPAPAHKVEVAFPTNGHLLLIRQYKLHKAFQGGAYTL